LTTLHVFCVSLVKTGQPCVGLFQSLIQ